jgi:3-oxoacyl-[acyl-carrier protein] reductase
MEISLSGRAAIVTGGSKGIGFAVATRFAASGADVAIVARTEGPLNEAVAAIRKSTQTRVIGIAADVGKAADIQRAYDEVMKTTSSSTMRERHGRCRSISSPTRSCTTTSN